MIDATARGLRHRLERLADDVALLDPALSDAARGLSAGIDEPLRLAVVGQVKAGKSTLVNALVGRRVAPTDSAECTRVVTWYRYGTVDGAVVHLRDGTSRPVRGDGDRLLPDVLPVPVGEISHAVVTVREAPLQRYTLIDTPGLLTATTENESATRRALLDLGQADALLYVFRERELADDVAFLQTFLRASGDHRGSAVDSIGVLSHADEIGPGAWADTDPVVVAHGLARSIAARHSGELATVLPLVGSLAEAASTGAITEQDADSLGSLDGADLTLLRYGVTPDDFDPKRFADLRARLGDYAIAHGREAGRGGAAQLTEWAAAAGGATALAAQLEQRCVGRHVQLRSLTALTALDRAADTSVARAEVRMLVAEAREDVTLHPLAELSAWQTLRARRPRSAMIQRFDAVMDAGDDRAALGLPRTASAQQVREAARAARTAVQAEGVLSGSSVERHAATVLDTSYRLISARTDRP